MSDTYFVSNFENLLKVLGHVGQLGLQRVHHIARVLLHVLAVLVVVGAHKLLQLGYATVQIVDVLLDRVRVLGNLGLLVVEQRPLLGQLGQLLELNTRVCELFAYCPRKIHPSYRRLSISLPSHNSGLARAKKTDFMHTFQSGLIMV